MTITSISTIAEIEAELSSGSVTMTGAHAVLVPRSERDSSSGRRAAKWLAAHPLDEVQAQPVRRAPAKGAGSKGGDPVKFGRGLYAQAFGTPGSPAFWAAYRSDECKALFAKVTTHKGARNVATKALKALV